VNANPIIAAWIARDAPIQLRPAALRLARRVPAIRDHLSAHLDDPLDRALAGLGDPPDDDSTLRSAVLSAQARTDGGAVLDPTMAAELEKRAEGDPEWWIPAARIHGCCSIDRQRQARSILARQILPYVFPGEIHPMMVDVIAAGDRVLPALHVDWVRKVTVWVSPLLVNDLRHCGLWFWPILGSLAPERLARPLPRLIETTKLPPGGLGMAVAYCHSIGTPGALFLDRCSPQDQLMAALAWASTGGSMAAMR
jgi:hypothetical protein